MDGMLGRAGCRAAAEWYEMRKRRRDFHAFFLFAKTVIDFDNQGGAQEGEVTDGQRSSKKRRGWENGW